MLHAYMDASGTHAGSPAVSISGFIGEESSWMEFDQRWQAVLDKTSWPSRLTEFHAVDCSHCCGEFFEGRWNFAERLHLYAQLAQVIKESRIQPVSASVISNAFDEIPHSDLLLLQEDSNRIGTPLDVAFHMITQQILSAVHVLHPGSTIDIVFDNDSENREAHFADSCDRYMSSFMLGDLFTGYSFSDSKLFTPLQAADLLAFGAHQLMQEKYINVPAPAPDFPMNKIFWDMLLGLAQSPLTSPYGTVCNADVLSAFVNKVKNRETLPHRTRATRNN